MSSSSDATKHRHALPRKCKIRKFYSTPILGEARSPSSISASAIDTTSSSGAKRKLIRTALGKERRERKKFQEERSSEMSKKERSKEKSISKKKKLSKKLEEKRSSRRKRTIRNEKQRKRIEARKSEYDWETYDESSRKSPEVKNLLFGDLPSPEHIREAPRNIDLLQSPILLPRIFPTATADSPKRIIADEEVRTLPVKDLALSFGFSDSDEEEEPELILNRQSNVRTYPPQKKGRAKKKNVGIDKSKTWLVDVSQYIPTVSSDLLWNDYVEKNYEKVRKYLAPPGRDERNSTNSSVEYINNDNSDFLGLAQNWSEETKLRLSRYRKKMDVTRRYYDKSSRKFVDVKDVYDFPGSEDNELFTDGGTKMTLNQYRQKRRKEKGNVEPDLSSSSPIFQPDVEETFRTSRHPLRKEKMKMKMKKPKTTMADVELQRIKDIRKFASRLKAKEEAMISNETSLCSTSKDDKPSCSVTSLERTYKDDIDGKQGKNKRLSSTKRKSVPTIKSVETLRTVRFEKDKKNWRIT